MRTFATLAFVSAAALSLAACGSSDSASEDAMADTVEMPADEAMTNAPMPAADTGVVPNAARDAQAPVAEPTQGVEDAAQAAEEAAADAAEAAAAAEAATRAAEETM
jgi:hypothetical protein